MSIFLFRLGGRIARRRGLVLAVWGMLLAALIGGASMLGTHYDDSFVIPGTQSQQGQDLLADRFGLTGTSGQVLITSTAGPITGRAAKGAVADIVDDIDGLAGVATSNPLTGDYPLVSDDSRSTIAQVRFTSPAPSDQTLDAVTDAATPSASSDLETWIGGDAFKDTSEPSRVPELLGLLVSFLILAVTFGSLLAAGMPILSSLVGVGVTMSSIVLITSVATVSSSAPTLAEMLGLAVGIDYALFILSRHRRHLGEGHSPTEAMSRALATAGSAVVFAGATVVIALTGLSVARIPVLTVMGLSAAAAVSIAVLLALTLLPAVALLLGERLRPKPRTPKERKVRRSRRHAGGTAEPRPPRTGFGTLWVRATTKVPLLTIAAVLALFALAASPASELRLALPDNSTAPTDTPQRETYDEITKAFGVGYNSPLSVTADIITSSDPSDTVDQLASKVAAVPDVVAILQATPNQEADTGLVALIPAEGQTAASTSELVQDLRDRSAGWEEELDVSDILVTGQTAINIDVSQRLGDALLPFASLVIGLSVVLLMIVFRSIAVPLKATLGYLLSVGAAFGAVVAAFQWGWLDPWMGESAGPIVSFLPIFVMGVLFGLAMDYEMFLVSAMREDYVQSRDPQQAVLRGFRASSVVVTAAALIMTSVFVAFIPGGSSTIKPIALGLAVGVAVDAFIVRMTLVPAVMVMLGHRAWWLPGWLDRLLPEVDVEGAALHRKIDYEEWEAGTGRTSLLARQLVVREGGPPIDVIAPPGTVTEVRVPSGVDERTLGQVLVGRTPARGGELVVGGRLLPEQREEVNRAATLVELGRADPASVTEERIRATARLASSRRSVQREHVDRTLALAAELDAHVGPGGSAVLWPATVQAAQALARQVEVVVLSGRDDLLLADDRRRADRLAAALADRGAGVVLLRTAPDEYSEPHDHDGVRTPTALTPTGRQVSHE
ncbi:MMPL family transporter [Nocardioides euryhalodurans]|uniref:MMPL family transporter n=1 Tax=Nocardioides euryhalodurans TaxID=2518370 RepID=A0A4V1BE94_9ACTN|nr:MMPL family transporter [Nocardioides euryhalodurans]QBR93832.1 MMPL family transporter [Nocardioides euryhalodurans]